ncbi:MAG: helix-turn-helix domain-containing protein [Acidobacteriota bacterium]|nr:helix-turn-helix domain-containing protein [Acidobacteriota bacterium]
MNQLRRYRTGRSLSQSALALELGVTQAYVSQVESGARPISRELAERLGTLPGLPASVIPAGHAEVDDADADLAAETGALGYPPFAAAAGARPRNPAAVIVAILGRRQVAPSVMAAVPWLLLSNAEIDATWLIDQVRLRNLQNRLGFLTDLAIDLAQSAFAIEDAHLEALRALRASLEESRLANEGTLARVLTSTERQFFEEHRSAAARHWHLLTGLTAAQLPYR